MSITQGTGHAGILLIFFLEAFAFTCAGSFLTLASQTIDADLGERVCLCGKRSRLLCKMSELVLSLTGIYRMVVIVGMMVFCKVISTSDKRTKVFINATWVALIS